MHVDLVKALGAVLRDARVNCALSQEELAGRIGLHRNTIGLVERGEIAISIETLDLVCRELGFPAWHFMLEAEFLRSEQ